MCWNSPCIQGQSERKMAAAVVLIVLAVGLTGPLVTAEIDEETVVVELVPQKDVVLPCHVKDNTTTNVMVWTRMEKVSSFSDENKYHLDEEKYTLTIHNSDWDDVGEYQCEVTAADNEKYTRQISLQGQPVVKKLEKSRNLYHGDDLVVECSVHGYPKPYVEWKKEEDPVVDSDDGRIKLFEFEGIANASLKIDNLQYDDRANYTCVAKVPNSNLTAQSSIMVRVKDRKEALWPAIGIIIMLIILAVIIIVDKRRHDKLKTEADNIAGGSQLDHPENDNLRQRKK